MRVASTPALCALSAIAASRGRRKPRESREIYNSIESIIWYRCMISCQAVFVISAPGTVSANIEMSPMKLVGALVPKTSSAGSTPACGDAENWKPKRR